ncbi:MULTISPECIES: type IV pilus, mannose-sensitive hemagglutinin D (MSHK) [Aliivibrio]|uniref:Type IV pilus, mannose-sensitive hemagglutinin D (MSHK) n=1 Tax=Aliivibrio finisterrensis TaxID=511998 RepID=A0A4Q5KX78_9GAMM|nr:MULTISPECIES: type IV pilus, mannose-sensitive hemagglutinin D (MSHK) [Aliivibrio]MDD9177565.1 type IV pilus, mannose-sensitive hemagglutinin D (MSHK) [Aliivibrio sp. A6]RYU54012.1 type IV pilus, mannose-sensitive hemagglutinin D (MSHK) [Aliivibrio finisterrensis]RYU56215.1 type IV pilus, mannose-sensitive hemagglutinin D (MSHK) [Aliivibrio finisterrensis]RYU60973.1 type IV pilus, mannose-sensitive hemagglutinin D (MSHK) [Aliivibrio finisterrensis]RYU67078.1 type IV pilus, mannose-sensitive
MKVFLILLALFSSFMFASDSIEGHDPTEPLSWTKPVAKKKVVTKKRHYFPSLQAISCSGTNDCYAVLDDKSMKKGDKVSGYTLLAIREDSVSIGRSGKTWQLSLFSQNIKN